ncbi:hypothetical protein ACFX15_002082 [Malus domestica]
MNETKTRVQDNICIDDLWVTISSTNLASDSIFVMGGFDVVDPNRPSRLDLGINSYADLSTSLIQKAVEA